MLLHVIKFKNCNTHVHYISRLKLNLCSSFHPLTMSRHVDFNPAFHHPSTYMVVGPSQSGKSRFVVKLIRSAQSMIDPPPERVIWCYGSHQTDLIHELRSLLEFVEFIPNVDELLDGRKTLLIIDDLMTETDGRVTNLFTKGSHHKNVSVVYISQNLYNKGKENRTISLKTHYLVLFKNPRDAAQISHLGRQIFPDKTKYFRDAFVDATSRPYGYLLIDLRTTTPDELRLRTDIFPDTAGTTVYLYK